MRKAQQLTLERLSPMSDVPEQVPIWAQELIREVTILNERLPNHITWTERNVLDHEKRLRTLEQFRWMILGVVAISGLLGGIVTKLLGL
jgi:hypothetical protein